jgi:glycosyltransferase involved in cell wall biosynthesis
MSLLEAAACGRPLVATDVPGCREVARPGKTGLLVAPDNPEALANALTALAADPVMRLRFGENARQLVSERFSSARIQREIVALYARLLGPLAPPRSAVS